LYSQNNEDMDVKVNVKDRILKPVTAVFNAIVDPDILSCYFISASSGWLKEGETITWSFSDVGGKIAVDVKKITANELFVFEWSASGKTALVTIHLAAIDQQTTSIEITEEGWPMDTAGVKSALGQTQGWTDFICSMKAYLYCGINLRLGRTKDSY
jgi:uncharacterized protein YndB with AHSA1/START domain